MSFKQVDRTPIILKIDTVGFPIDDEEHVAGDRDLVPGDIVMPIRDDTHRPYVVCLTRSGPVAILKSAIGWTWND